MPFTEHAIEDMGFVRFPQTDVIKARFGLLRVYSLRGVFFKKDCEIKLSESISMQEDCTVLISHSVNEAARLLAGDVFVEDEEKWLSTNNKATPPFVLIYFQESIDRELRGGFRQEKDGRILTYDAFSEAKKEIKEWEEDAIPSIVTSITVNFSTIKNQIHLVDVGRSVHGLTGEGRVIIDLKASFRFGDIYASSPKSVEEFNTLLEKSKKLLPNLGKDTCRHFYAALSEPDKTQKFISYFQFIERYTHSTYKTPERDTCENAHSGLKALMYRGFSFRYLSSTPF